MSYARVFKNPVVLKEMIILRLQGWPLKELAFKYGCEHTSVRKACIRNGLPNEVPLLPRPIIIFRPVYRDFDGERVNLGKSYREYLEEQKRHTPIQRSRSKVYL